MGRAYREEPRLYAWSQIRPELHDLIKRFGPPGAESPEEPYKRLPNDDLWEIHDAEGNNLGYQPNLSLTALAETRGGFPASDYDALKADKSLILKCAQRILSEHFPESMHDDILIDVKLPTIRVSDDTQLKEIAKRDPDFRRKILRIYRRRCAVCHSGLRLVDSLIDLEAAHIKWFKAGGPDVENNGLALCTFHHKAFDRGAFGLRVKSDEYLIQISPDLNGPGPSQRWLTDYDAKPLLKPAEARFQPEREYVEWHYEQVFKQ